MEIVATRMCHEMDASATDGDEQFPEPRRWSIHGSPGAGNTRTRHYNLGPSRQVCRMVSGRVKRDSTARTAWPRNRSARSMNAFSLQDVAVGFPHVPFWSPFRVPPRCGLGLIAFIFLSSLSSKLSQNGAIDCAISNVLCVCALCMRFVYALCVCALCMCFVCALCVCLVCFVCFVCALCGCVCVRALCV